MTVRYEWVVELTAAADTEQHECGEIVDTRGCDSYADALRLAAELEEPGFDPLIVLVRDDDAGRAWAYFEDGEDGQLPSHFADAYGSDVAKVPKRYAAEVSRRTVAPS